MANYPYNYNPYIQELQGMRDRIDNTMRQYQNQMPQQPQIHQNFQLVPMQNGLEAKYVNSLDEVKNTFVMREGIFINKETNTLWIKNISGDIKTYTLTEVIEVDPKDAEIAELKNELASMKELLNQKEKPSETKSKKEA